MADTDHPVGDELDLRPNGTVRIGIGGTFHALRMPRVGEYRKLREMWAELSLREAALVDEANAVPIAERTGAWRIGLDDAVTALFGDWSLEAVGMLSTKGETPAVDDLTPWMFTAAFGAALFEHWRSLPLAASSSRR